MLPLGFLLLVMWRVNGQADILAKQALKIKYVDLQVPLSKAEAETFIGAYAHQYGRSIGTIMKLDDIYTIYECIAVGAGRTVRWKQSEENVITCLRIGQTGLNHALYV